ncbi:zeta toxin family protein [Dyadobacter sp. NIV53]|uniref:zeta toxin family protein n=1 Tax=Dyadobacter sp. NIV53 TaxID=2861765 RepID=UPI001C88BDD4|nr:zeta toxin family protein [Dyadobacter sp. NIV53]
MNSIPLLIIIGGPNGSGKTTLSSYLIKKGRINVHLTPVINPDDIALTIAGSDQADKEFQAARIALAKREHCISERQSFAIETTFSGNSEIRLLNQAKEAGYKIIGYFVTLKNVKDSIARVKDRVEKGGHNVPTKNLLIRYE